MSIRTALTGRFALEYPIVSAPMGSVAGDRLAAAVSNAGALGLVGGAYGDPDWLSAELSTARSEAKRPWGVGLITWHATHEAVELALSYEPHTFMLGAQGALMGTRFYAATEAVGHERPRSA